MSNLHTKHCETCGHVTRLYAHTINKPLVSALAQAYKFGKDFNLQKDLSLTKNQYNNFQKLQYFGLISKHRGTTQWHVTLLGENFILGRVPICNKAFTFGKEIVPVDEVEIITGVTPVHSNVFVSDVLKSDYKKLQDYLTEL